MNDLVVRNIGRLTTWHGPVVEHAAVVITGGRVAWAGHDSDLPVGLGDVPELDASGAAVLPGFVDSHTHAVWAGSRRDDFIGRVSGASYTPHGIHSTVAATRAASYDELLALTTERLIEMRRHGTTTVEIKSGYGLTPGDEVQLLAVARQAADKTGLAATTTYLGAHAVPPERDRADYVDEVVATIPAAVDAGAQWCDVFCDEGAFTVDETRLVLTAARDAGLGLRMHAEQIAHTGAARLAADLGCASADHLDHVTPEDAQALAAAGVVATLVPVASLYSRSMRWDHARTLREFWMPRDIRTAGEPDVVTRKQHFIAAGDEIRFQRIRTLRNRQRETLERVLRAIPARATMSNDARRQPVQGVPEHGMMIAQTRQSRNVCDAALESAARANDFSTAGRMCHVGRKSSLSCKYVVVRGDCGRHAGVCGRPSGRRR